MKKMNIPKNIIQKYIIIINNINNVWGTLVPRTRDNKVPVLTAQSKTICFGLNVRTMKKKFPYQIHLILGLIWCVVGIAFYAGYEAAIWVAGGLIMIIIGLLNKK